MRVMVRRRIFQVLLVDCWNSCAANAGHILVLTLVNSQRVVLTLDKSQRVLHGRCGRWRDGRL